MSNRVSGRNNASLAAMLAEGVSYRQVDNWVRRGFLHPEITSTKNGGRDVWTWPPAEQLVVVKMARLVAAGLRPEAAERVARSPSGMPVVLGPQIVISLFPLRTEQTEAMAS